MNRLIALVLVLFLSFENFGSIVGSNDGSAFITKAEFEDLKVNFNEQINLYNSALDSKIDGKIATYVAGIRLGAKQIKKSTLQVAGQTYQGVSRKSYVFCGNDSVYFMRRYNDNNKQFTKNVNASFDVIPNLRFYFLLDVGTSQYRFPSTGAELWGSNSTRIDLNYEYRPKKNDGTFYSVGNATIFLVDDENYVTGYKLDSALFGRAYRIGSCGINDPRSMSVVPYISSSYHWNLNFKNVVGTDTNGMGYSTRSLSDETASTLQLYYLPLVAMTSSSVSGYVYTNKSFVSRGGTTYYILVYNNVTPRSISKTQFANDMIFSEWYDDHLHFEESRFGSSYAWCMPFGHLLTDRKAACFSQWPAWEAVNWKSISGTNVGTVNSSTDKLVSDSTGNYNWFQTKGNTHVAYDDGISRQWAGAYSIDIADYIDIAGVLPYYKTDPMKDWRLLKNKNINNALGLDAYYAAAPPLTDEFESSGSFTWVAKVNQQDVERIPGRTWSNWGNTRIYFTNGTMDDIEYSGTDVKVSNTKKFQYKKHGTTDDWADCISQVLDGKTYYYLTMDHDTYYDFKMDVDVKETVYYMIFDEKRPDDYCLEVIEHPDYQIEFTSD